MSIVTLNTLVALAVGLVAIGAVKRMSARTDCAVRWAILLIVVGGIGQAIGFFSETWDHYLDTLFYGGVLALLLAEQRGQKAEPSVESQLQAMWPGWLPMDTRSISMHVSLLVEWLRYAAQVHAGRWRSYAATLATVASVLAYLGTS
jgi:hypothetical protein